MALETGTYISDLVATNPTASDPKSQGDDHLRLVKSTVKATFPNITGAVTPTHTELNYVAGATSALQTQMNLKAPKDTATFTGNTTLPATTVIGTVTSAEITYLSGVTSSIQTQVNARASLSSPAFTGTPTAPTASAGTSTTQLATTAFVASTAFSAALPAQTGNSGKFVTTNGTTASWAFAGISQVTTATTATTLTSTPTLLQITPTSYGVTVTLPDATTCSVGGPLHCIDNRGAYPVRVCNTSGTLLGFVFAGVVSYIALDDKSTAGGVWAISNNELVGASAQLLTSSILNVYACIDIGSSRELIICGNGSAHAIGVVYDRSTNTFGSVTTVRAASISNRVAVVFSAANQVLVVSCDATTGFEAVTLSISGTTITVNTAATATLSANMTAFADGCGLIAVGSSFVTSYSASGAGQLRALTISGTTVTIGSATVLTYSNGTLIVNANNTGVIALSYSGTNLNTNYYGISGTTITTGTGVTSASGTYTASSIKLFALGTRWGWAAADATAGSRAAVISLSGTTVTVSIAVMTADTGNNPADAIVVGSNKVLVLHQSTTNNANILTDTSGTASAGTALTVNGYVSSCLYLNGTDVYISGYTGGSVPQLFKVSCSGASPVLTTSYMTSFGSNNVPIGYTTASNSVLSKAPQRVASSSAVHYLTGAAASSSSATGQRFSFSEGAYFHKLGTVIGSSSATIVATNFYRGVSQSQSWYADSSTVITKVECVA